MLSSLVDALGNSEGSIAERLLVLRKEGALRPVIDALYGRIVRQGSSSFSPLEHQQLIAVSIDPFEFENALAALGSSETAQRNRSRSPRRVLDGVLSSRVLDANLWRLASGKKRGNTTYYDIVSDGTVHMKTYHTEEWQRGSPSHFTPFTVQALAKTYPLLKFGISIACGEVAETISSLDKWAVDKLRFAMADSDAAVDFKPSLYKSERQPPILDTRLFMDEADKPTAVFFDNVAQKSTREAFTALQAKIATWHEWQRIPIRAEVKPVQIWVSNGAKAGMVFKLVRLCVRGVEA